MRPLLPTSSIACWPSVRQPGSELWFDPCFVVRPCILGTSQIAQPWHVFLLENALTTAQILRVPVSVPVIKSLATLGTDAGVEPSVTLA